MGEIILGLTIIAGIITLMQIKLNYPNGVFLSFIATGVLLCIWALLTMKKSKEIKQ